ncbi:hypothetical protein bcgnr5377_07640 [Bacillus cereus]
MKEEASIDTTILNSPTTYYKENWNAQSKEIKVENEVNPILIIDSPDESLSEHGKTVSIVLDSMCTGHLEYTVRNKL